MGGAEPGWVHRDGDPISPLRWSVVVNGLGRRNSQRRNFPLLTMGLILPLQGSRNPESLVTGVGSGQTKHF